MIIEENKNKKIIIVTIICLFGGSRGDLRGWQIRKKALDTENKKKASFNSPQSLPYEGKN